MRKYEVTWTEISRYRTVVMANDSVEAAEVAMREGDLETLSQDSDHFEVRPVDDREDELVTIEHDTLPPEGENGDW